MSTDADRGDWRNAARGYKDQRDVLQGHLDIVREENGQNAIQLAQQQDQIDVLQAELVAARARATEDDRHVRAFAQKNGQLWAENERLRALLAHRTADHDAVVAERDAALERVAELKAAIRTHIDNPSVPLEHPAVRELRSVLGADR